MAKNIGLLKFSGSLDGVVSYKRSGKHVLQRKGGFDGARTRTEERYEGTRQRQSEFGRCAGLASVLKRCLQGYLDCIPDVYIYNWIQTAMLVIKGFDVDSAKGEKTVGKGWATEQGRRFLERFSFNRVRGLSSVISADYVVDMEKGELVITDFVPKQGLRFPKGYGMAGLEFVVVRLDFEGVACVVGKSGVVLVGRGDEESCDLALNVDLPKGEGVLMGMLFVGYCEGEGEGLRWFRNEGSVLQVVGVSGH